MPECTVLSDRMPDLAAGRDAWSPADQRHLAGCAECAAEWALVRAAGGLGDGLGYAPDAGALSSVVTRRLAGARRDRSVRQRRTWVAAAFAVAAAIMLLVWDGRPHAARGPAVSPAPAVQSAALVPELDSLDAGELRDVLDAFDAPLSERVIIGPPGIGDLSDQELERVLRAGGV